MPRPKIARQPIQTEGIMTLLVGYMAHEIYESPNGEPVMCNCINGKLMNAAGSTAPIERRGLAGNEAPEKAVRQKFRVTKQQMQKMMDLNDRLQAKKLHAYLVRLRLITPAVKIVIRETDGNFRVREIATSDSDEKQFVNENGEIESLGFKEMQ